MTRKIPFVDPAIDAAEVEAVKSVVESKLLIESKNTREFESKFQKFTGAKHALACTNGTSALHLSLEAAGINPGDEVLTTPFTFIATSNSILFTGAVPKFLDVDTHTWNLDPEVVEANITEKTKAIMPVHIFGLGADMPAFRDLAEDHSLLLIEDAAQAVGAKINGQHVGVFGDVAAFSLYATKNLISGEGGVVTTNNDEIADKVNSLKNHGRTLQGGYKHIRVGYNYRMTDMQGAIANVQMDKIEHLLANRKKNAELYRKTIDEIENLDYQHFAANFEPANYIFALDTRDHAIKPADAIAKFKEADILARPIYNKLSYQQENFKNIETWRWARVIDYPDYNKVKLPIAEAIALNHFEIPVVPSLTDEEREKVATSIRNIFG